MPVLPLNLTNLTTALAPARKGLPKLTGKTWYDEAARIAQEAVKPVPGPVTPVPTPTPPVTPPAPLTYHPLPVISFKQAEYRVGPGSTFVDVEIEASNGPVGNTCYFEVRAKNGTAVEGSHFLRFYSYERLRPGDEPFAVCRIMLKNRPASGSDFSVFFPSEVHGCKLGAVRSARVVFDDAAPRTVSAARPSRRAGAVWAPQGAPTLKDDFTVSKITDDGANGTWKNQFENGRDPPNTDEQGLYVAENVSISGGRLVVSATPAGANNPAYKGRVYSYWAAVAQSRKFFSQLYGHWSIRATLPTGKQPWPAFWLLPQDGTWPPEIDILEVIQGAYVFSQHCGSNQKRDAVYSVKALLKSLVPSFDPLGPNDWQIDWRKDYLTWFLNGVEICQQRTYFHKPAYLLIQIAVGGSGGTPTFTTPETMPVEEVTVWS